MFATEELSKRLNRYCTFGSIIRLLIPRGKKQGIFSMVEKSNAQEEHFGRVRIFFGISRSAEQMSFVPGRGSLPAQKYIARDGGKD